MRQMLNCLSLAGFFFSDDKTWSQIYVSFNLDINRHSRFSLIRDESTILIRLYLAVCCCNFRYSIRKHYSRISNSFTLRNYWYLKNFSKTVLTSNISLSILNETKKKNINNIPFSVSLSPVSLWVTRCSEIF